MFTNDWVEDFFSITGKWWGKEEKKVTSDDYERVEIIKRLAGPPPKRILELGSSYGTTARVCAEAGYETVGVEISDRILATRPRENLALVKIDFYNFKDRQKFDVVTYWNGFGIGTDADLKKILNKMADEWLKPKGCALIDIQNPFWWEKWAGQKEIDDYIEVVEFDPVKCQFLDTWWRKEKPEAKVTQQMRCFTPADFRLLVEGTGLKVDKMEISEKPEHEYLVRLVKS